MSKNCPNCGKDHGEGIKEDSTHCAIYCSCGCQWTWVNEEKLEELRKSRKRHENS